LRLMRCSWTVDREGDAGNAPTVALAVEDAGEI
jgi:hypothetical protein